jgi:hypothetical protein
METIVAPLDMVCPVKSVLVDSSGTRRRETEDEISLLLPKRIAENTTDHASGNEANPKGCAHGNCDASSNYRQEEYEYGLRPDLLRYSCIIVIASHCLFLSEFQM